MLGAARRRLGNSWRRTRHAIAYWWLEQRDMSSRSGGPGRWKPSRRPTWRRPRLAWLGALLAPVAAAPRVLRRRVGLVGAAQAGRARGAAGRAARSPAALRGLVAAVVVLVSVLLAGPLLEVTPDGDDRAGMSSADTRPGDRSGDAGTGSGRSRPGIRMTASPDEAGAVEVEEQVLLPRPVRTLPLAAPPPEPGDDAGPAPRLLDLEVTADGTEVPVGDLATLAGRQVLRLPTASRSFRLSYRVVDADRRSARSAPGRATLSLRPAAAAAVPAGPAVVTVRDAVVHTLVCVEAPVEDQLCGVDSAQGWRTEPLAAADSRVVALVDLPAP